MSKCSYVVCFLKVPRNVLAQFIRFSLILPLYLHDKFFTENVGSILSKEGVFTNWLYTW